MNINIIREFLCVAKYLNYSEAAKVLYITQPMLSRHINAMEEELGAKVFLRNTQSVRMTEIGEMFQQDAQEIIRLYDNALHKVNLKATGYEDVLYIGYPDLAVRHFLPSFITFFEKQYPQVELNTYSLNPGDIIRMLNSGKLDVGFYVGFNDGCFNGLSYLNVYNEAMAVVVRHNHPSAGQDSIDFSVLANETFIRLEPVSFPSAWEFVTKLCAEHGVTPKQSARQALSPEETLLMVEVGYGVVLLPYHCVKLATPSIKFLKLQNNEMITIDVIWKKANNKPALKSFLKELMKSTAKYR